MSELLEIHLIVGGFIILCCAAALRFRLFDALRKFIAFEPQNISFLNGVLWLVIAGLVFVILRDLWRNAHA